MLVGPCRLKRFGNSKQNRGQKPRPARCVSKSITHPSQTLVYILMIHSHRGCWASHGIGLRATLSRWLVLDFPITVPMSWCSRPCSSCSTLVYPRHVHTDVGSCSAAAALHWPCHFAHFVCLFFPFQALVTRSKLHQVAENLCSQTIRFFSRVMMIFKLSQQWFLPSCGCLASRLSTNEIFPLCSNDFPEHGIYAPPHPHPPRPYSFSASGVM